MTGLLYEKTCPLIDKGQINCIELCLGACAPLVSQWASLLTFWYRGRWQHSRLLR